MFYKKGKQHKNQKMKRFIQLLASACVILFLNSCIGTGIPIVKEKPYNNQTYKVEYLFEHDGYRVFRFYDKGNYVYFTTPAGMTTAIKNDSTRHRTTSFMGS